MRRRAIGQILLLAAGFLVLVAISATSVVLVNQARGDSGVVVHTVEVETSSQRCCQRRARSRPFRHKDPAAVWPRQQARGETRLRGGALAGAGSALLSCRP
jgi:hypothetical protein